MDKLTIGPLDFSGLFGDELGDQLLFVLGDEARRCVDVDRGEGASVEVFAWNDPQASRAALVEHLAARRARGLTTSAVWIASDEFEHFDDDELESARIAALTSYSRPFSPETLAETLRIVRNTDYVDQLRVENEFLRFFDEADHIAFVDSESDRHAVFEHRATEHWFSLHGPLGYGQQAVLPSGELSALVDESGAFSSGRFPLDGSVVLAGQPIIHRGADDVSVDETQATFRRLSTMSTEPAVVEITEGAISAVEPLHPGRTAFSDALSGLIAAEPRYAKVHEIGFGTNPECADLAASNFFPNERFPGLHLGIGLGGYTPFHIDLVTTRPRIHAVRADGSAVDVYRAVGLEVPSE